MAAMNGIRCLVGRVGVETDIAGRIRVCDKHILAVVLDDEGDEGARGWKRGDVCCCA